ncbi:MAG: uncharacterized protein QOI58_2965 [Thermoanaerobaculia bacterium]|jgi:uncharacterized protein (UPF0276 family)|nr:uncharacterized protein [Thermoanaerobaculia bacterium]
MTTPLPDLGVGVVYIPGIGKLLEDDGLAIDVIEVEPQTLWRRRGERYVPDDEIIGHVSALPQRKLVHGVGCPVGGSVPHDEEQVTLFADSIRTFGAPWASEHLSFNRAYGDGVPFNAGFLLPPLQTRAGATAAAVMARSLASRLPVPLAVETGVNYLRPRPSEMSDGAFVAAVADGADCGILLDLHNLWANERNGRQPVREFLDEIPLDRVWEVHVAGGFEYGGYWLDAHSGLMPEALLELAAEVVPKLPNVHAIIFEMVPQALSRTDVAVLRRQVETLRTIWSKRGTRVERQPPKPQATAPIDNISPRDWQDTLGALAVGREVTGPLADAISADPAVPVFQKLVWQVRAGMIVDNFPFASRLLMLSRGEEFLRGLFNDFFARVPPEFFGSTESDAFAAYLRERQIDEPYLDDVLAYEHAAMHVQLDGGTQVIRTRHDPNGLVAALSEDRIPSGVEEDDFEIVVS